MKQRTIITSLFGNLMRRGTGLFEGPPLGGKLTTLLSFLRKCEEKTTYLRAVGCSSSALEVRRGVAFSNCGSIASKF
jgi:TfoX/Sxy family transcriptional regulator of competence genes